MKTGIDGLWYCEKGLTIHNHSPPSEWKVLPHVLLDIIQAVSCNIHVTPKGIQNGQGIDYEPMEASIVAAKYTADKTNNERILLQLLLLFLSLRIALMKVQLINPI